MRAAGGAILIGPGVGRGAWLCSGRPECFDRARTRGAFARALRTEIAPAALEAVRGRLYP